MKENSLLCFISFSCVNHTFLCKNSNYVCLPKEPGVDPAVSFSSLNQIYFEYKAEFISESRLFGWLDVVTV